MLVVGPSTFVLPHPTAWKTTCAVPTQLFLIVKEQPARSFRTGSGPYVAGPGETRGANRDRTGNLLVANQALSQLSYSPVVTSDRRLTNVGLSRVELLTSRLSGVRSNHLSYRPQLAFWNLDFAFWTVWYVLSQSKLQNRESKMI